MSFNADYYRKLHAQKKLSYHQVQFVLEELIAELSLIQPSNPNTYILHKLDEMQQNEMNKLTEINSELQTCNNNNNNNIITNTTTMTENKSMSKCKENNLTSSLGSKRLLISIFGSDKSGKSTQCNAITKLMHHNIYVLSPEKLIEEAILGGRERDCKVVVYIPPDLQQTIKTFVMNGLQLSADVMTRLILNKITQIESDIMYQEHKEEHGEFELTVKEEISPYEHVAQAAALAATMNDVTVSSNVQAPKLKSSIPVIYILDGYPRNIEQAVKLQNDIGEVRAAVQLICTPTVLQERCYVKDSFSLPANTTHCEKAHVSENECNDCHYNNNSSSSKVTSTNCNINVDEQLAYLSEFWKAHHVYHAIDATGQDRRCIAKTIVNKIFRQ